LPADGRALIAPRHFTSSRKNFEAPRHPTGAVVLALRKLSRRTIGICRAGLPAAHLTARVQRGIDPGPD